MVPVKKTTTFTDEELKNMAIVRITQPVNFDIMAQETGVDKKLMARWNPDFELYIYNTYPTPFYNLRMPKDKLDLFLQKKEVINKKSKAFFAQLK